MALHQHRKGARSNTPSVVVVCRNDGSELCRWRPGNLSITLATARSESRLEHLCYVVQDLKIRAAFRNGHELDLPQMACE